MPIGTGVNKAQCFCFKKLDFLTLYKLVCESLNASCLLS